ncbi:hypothetical protein IAR50_005252 [Cryptococcus sp. DSM 104548]
MFSIPAPTSNNYNPFPAVNDTDDNSSTSSSQEALPRYEECPPAYNTHIVTAPHPGPVVRHFSQTHSISIGQIICQITPGSILRFQSPHDIQTDVTATVRRYYGPHYELFQRVLVVRNYMCGQLSKLVDEYRSVAASGKRLSSKEMVATLSKALTYIYTDLQTSSSGLTYGLNLLITSSKTTYHQAIQTGGSIVQPTYFEHDTPEVRDVVRGLVRGKEEVVERAVESAFHPYVEPLGSDGGDEKWLTGVGMKKGSSMSAA